MDLSCLLWSKIFSITYLKQSFSLIMAVNQPWSLNQAHHNRLMQFKHYIINPWIRQPHLDSIAIIFFIFLCEQYVSSTWALKWFKFFSFDFEFGNPCFINNVYLQEPLYNYIWTIFRLLTSGLLFSGYMYIYKNHCIYELYLDY